VKGGRQEAERGRQEAGAEDKRQKAVAGGVRQERQEAGKALGRKLQAPGRRQNAVGDFYSVVFRAARSFSWMPPKPPFDIIATTSPRRSWGRRCATICSAPGSATAGLV
jgi:hypothetical protein